MRIANGGWGKQFLDSRSSNGHWGLHFYQPKWTSTHYTLLDLKHLGIDPNNPACREMVFRTFHECQKKMMGYEPIQIFILVTLQSVEWSDNMAPISALKNLVLRI